MAICPQSRKEIPTLDFETKKNERTGKEKNTRNGEGGDHEPLFRGSTHAMGRKKEARKVNK